MSRSASATPSSTNATRSSARWSPNTTSAASTSSCRIRRCATVRSRPPLGLDAKRQSAGNAAPRGFRSAARRRGQARRDGLLRRRVPAGHGGARRPAATLAGPSARGSLAAAGRGGFGGAHPALSRRQAAPPPPAGGHAGARGGRRHRGGGGVDEEDDPAHSDQVKAGEDGSESGATGTLSAAAGAEPQTGADAAQSDETGTGEQCLLGEGEEQPGQAGKRAGTVRGSNEPPPGGYRPFTVEYDEIVPAETPCDMEELSRLPALLAQ